MKIINYDQCERCKSKTENLYHMMFECEMIRKFWKNVEALWERCTGEKITLNLKHVFVGFLGEKRNNILN